MKKQNFSFSVPKNEKWSIRVQYGDVSADLTLMPPNRISVKNEKCNALPVFDPGHCGWNTHYGLKRVMKEHCCWAEGALVPGSVVVKGPRGIVYERGKDFEYNDDWACVGRVESGRIAENTPVRISYTFCRARIDAIVLDQNNTISVLKGKEHDIMPKAPMLKKGMKRLANIYFSRHDDKLREGMVYPVLKKSFRKRKDLCDVEKLLPETMKKIRSGEPLKILAWGDSVTECVYLPETQHWQTLFYNALRKKYPNANIQLQSHGWGGRCAKTFLDEPADSPHNFEKFIENADADLVVSEFVNDAGLPKEAIISSYNEVLKRLRAAGKEWLILTPHTILPSWMGLDWDKAHRCPDDPRFFVQFLRSFAKENNIALADGSARYGELFELGIPYMCVMTNGINHPDLRGMKVFCKALMEIFPEI